MRNKSELSDRENHILGQKSVLTVAIVLDVRKDGIWLWSLPKDFVPFLC